MNQVTLCTRVLPSSQKFRWYQKIKGKHKALQERYVDLQERIPSQTPVVCEPEDTCFFLCIEHKSNRAIEEELIPNDAADKLIIESFTTNRPIENLKDGDILIIPWKLLSNVPILVNHQVIVVASNEHDYKDADIFFQRNPNVNISLLKDLREKADLLLEETMFKPMANIAEYLGKILQDNRTATGKHISNNVK